MRCPEKLHNQPYTIILILITFSSLFNPVVLGFAPADLAFRKPATQSSTYADKVASLAVDGNPATCSVAGVGSDSTEYAWWQVDLEQTYKVGNIEITNTLDAYESMYLTDFHILVGITNSTVRDNTNTLCNSYNNATITSQTLYIGCTAGDISGRFVTIRRYGGFRQDALSLCDVKITSNPVTGTSPVDRATASEGYPLHLVDLDPTKAVQSRTFSTFGAELAVDKDLFTCSIAGVSSESRDYGWWQIDLGATYRIAAVFIVNTERYYESLFMNQFNIFIDKRPFEGLQKCASYNNEPPIPRGGKVNFTCTPEPLWGHYVTIKRFGGFRQDALSLCEVSIYELPDGTPPSDHDNDTPALKQVIPLAWNQSSVFGLYSASVLFDGKPETCFVIGEGSNSGNFAWLRLDLGSVYQLYSVTLLNIYDYYESLYMNQIEISMDQRWDAPIGTGERKICSILSQSVAIEPRGHVTLTCIDNSTLGRYLTLRRLGGFRQDALSACEMTISVVNNSVTTRTTRATTTIIPTTTITTPTTTITTPTTTITTPTTAVVTTSSRTMVCPEGQFKCVGENKCIDIARKCDGSDDCTDRSDELNCNCASQDKFRCNNTRCIELSWVCDTENDCGDNSDETNCSCKQTEFRCNSGQCIKLSLRCNNFDNCGDNSDEVNCGTCSRGLFHCSNGKCIQNIRVCDGRYDCDDASDEIGCDCSNGYICNITHLCITKDKICDTIKDCPDNSDEINCSCLAHQYRCLKGVCIHKDWLCDGVKDCPLGDDESVEMCPKCGPTEFSCFHRASCVKESKRCDGNVDCSDGTDELNCLTLVKSNSTLLLQLLKMTMNGIDGYYVCGENWQDEWSRAACSYMGLGYAEGTSLETVSSTKFVVLKKNPIFDTPSFVSFFNTSSECLGNQVISLKCSNSSCGIRSETFTDFGPYIVNGDVAKKGAWPWDVQIFVNSSYYCGGSLLSDNRWVLTAGHCVFSEYTANKTMLTSEFFMVMGTNILQRSINIPEFIYSIKDNKDIQFSFAEKIFIHPLYNDDDIDYDYALIKLAQPVSWTSFVRPVCLPPPEYMDTGMERYKVCVAIGFGKTRSTSILSGLLLQGRMNIMSYEDCIKDVVQTVGLSENTVNSSLNRRTMFCAGANPNLGSPSTCKGDSGSALLCQNYNSEWVVQGLSSFSFQTLAYSCRNSVYSRVSSAVEWIYQTTRSNIFD